MGQDTTFTAVGDTEGQCSDARLAKMLRMLESIPDSLPAGTDPFAGTGLCPDSDLELLSADA